VRCGRAAEGLVVAAGVEGEFAEEFAVLGVDDADVAVGDEGQNAFAGVFAAQADVAQLAVVAQRDDPGGVGLVAADPVVDRDRGFGGLGLRAGGVGVFGVRRSIARCGRTVL
jgi:hypothetical protein